jgi:hypothetical protein
VQEAAEGRTEAADRPTGQKVYLHKTLALSHEDFAEARSVEDPNAKGKFRNSESIARS